MIVWTTLAAVLFPFVFVGMWCAVSLLLSAMGGWHRLAEKFPALHQPSGKPFFMQGGKVGMVTYSGCLIIYNSPEGLYLSVFLLFRVGHPPIFIPWNAIRNARSHRFLWTESVVFDIGSPTITTLKLSKKVFEGRHIAV
ncbi:MAG: hypothetical protein JXB10_16855 [Pirellulales bacterium]|nr:hypothetical protein [Pirellulales bacterium]